jgi:CRISPR-associated protein Cas2
MQYILIYDITHDRARAKVADLCLDYGLQRIQYSAFTGNIPRTLQEELLLKIKRVLRNRDADVRVIPICERDWAQAKHVQTRAKGGSDA